MARKVLTMIKLQIPAAAANPAPPVGPALGQHGVNIMEFCKAFNAQTQADAGTIIPVEITVFEDRSFTFITKTPPAAVLIKQAIGIEKGSGEPNREKVGTISRDQVRQIAETKLPDLNAHDVDQAMKIIEGTARSMGVDVGMSKHGKRYRELREQIDRTREYPPAEAVSTVKAMQSAKFTEAVEVHIRLGVNVRHADQQVRGTMVLPHGLGRDVTVAVFAQGDKAREAEAAGADAVGGEDLAERVSGGWTDFDVAIATPDMMPVVGKLGRVLGPQGKMPNPKVGHRHRGRRPRGRAGEGRAGSSTAPTAPGIVHLVIGRADFDERRLLENYAALIEEIVRAKPAAAKGRYIRSVTLTTTMGPGVHVDPTRTRDLAGGGSRRVVPSHAPTTLACAPKTAGGHRRKPGPGGGSGMTDWSAFLPACVRAFCHRDR